jgi:hypothetical protein
MSVKVQQISVFLENKAGRLIDVSRVLGANSVNIRALSLADTADYGILRLIVNDPDKACAALESAGFTVIETEVIAVEIPDVPGGLGKALEPLQDNGMNVEYLYSFVEKSGESAIVVFRVEDVEDAAEALRAKGFRLMEGDDIYRL